MSDSPGVRGGDSTQDLPPAKLTGEALTPATTTPLPWAGPDCPVEKVVCDAALKVADIVDSQDQGRFAELLEATRVTCVSELLLATGPVCRDDTVGSQVDGVGWFVKQAQMLPLSLVAWELSPRWGDYREAGAAKRVLVACPGERASDCSSHFAVSFPSVEQDVPPLVLIFARDGTSYGIVAVSLVPSGFYGAVAGGWANTGHPALDIPDRQWFVPWQAR